MSADPLDDAALNCSGGVVHGLGLTLDPGAGVPSLLTADNCQVQLVNSSVGEGGEVAIELSGDASLAARNTSLGGGTLDRPAVSVQDSSFDILYFHPGRGRFPDADIQGDERPLSGHPGVDQP